MFITLVAAALSAALAQPNALTQEEHALAVSEVQESAALFVDAVLDDDHQAATAARKEFLREAGEYGELARSAGGRDAAAAVNVWALEAQKVSGVLDMRPFWDAAGRAVAAQDRLTRELAAE